uniref:Cilia- and flagella-associated protein 91 n=1 Tax=Cyprinus carpio TaxID=7962 RepID=A0A8C2BY39_CYPCA
MVVLFLDPVYTLSADEDHAREILRAHASVDRQKVPEFNALKPLTLATDPVPAFIDRRWRGYSPCPCSNNFLPLFSLSPLIPFTQQITPDVVFALPKSSGRSVGVQTDYRESETQTDPFTPDYAVRPGTAPTELLTLATLTWGLAEVEMIERARMKRAWEATLPSLKDLSQLDKRRRMMEEMERKEWAFREFGSKQHQAEVKMDRLDVKSSIDVFNNKEALRSLSAMWKLLAKRRNVEGKLERRDVIKDYSDYGFQTYVPLSRFGPISDRNSNRNMVKGPFLSTYEGLLELEAGLSPSVMESRINVPRPKVTKGFITCSARRELELMKTHQVMSSWKKPLRFLFKTEKPASRPPTPGVETPPEVQPTIMLWTIQVFLPKNLAFDEKMCSLQVKTELRPTHTLQKEELDKKEAEKQVTLALQRQRDIQSERVSQIESYISGLSGGVIVDMLDFLSKDLLRLHEERRIHAFSLLAERNRRIRETEENKYAVISCLCFIWHQVVKVHQDTVDMYLEDVILGSINQTADAQAREEIHCKAEELNNITYSMEEMNSQQSEETVAELIYRFLIPEVQKITVRERVRQSQRRHLQAARSIIRSSPGSSAVSQPPSPSDRASSLVLNDILSQVEDAVPRTVTPRDPGPARNNLSSDPTADTRNRNGKHAD